MFESFLARFGYTKKTEKRSYAAAEKKARYGDFKSSRGSADYAFYG